LKRISSLQTFRPSQRVRYAHRQFSAHNVVQERSCDADRLDADQPLTSRHRRRRDAPSIISRARDLAALPSRLHPRSAPIGVGRHDREADEASRCATEALTRDTRSLTSHSPPAQSPGCPLVEFFWGLLGLMDQNGACGFLRRPVLFKRTTVPFERYCRFARRTCASGILHALRCANMRQKTPDLGSQPLRFACEGAGRA
jgi:hypothetical protein